MLRYGLGKMRFPQHRMVLDGLIPRKNDILVTLSRHWPPSYGMTGMEV